MAAATLARTLAQNHRIDFSSPELPLWSVWQQHPTRSRVWFIKGGPGQGKSTLTQYMSQIQRAALILSPAGPVVTPSQRSLAEEIRDTASKDGFWPIAPRIPVVIDLKEFAFWFGQKAQGSTDRIIGFLTERLSHQIGEEVKAGTLRRAFASARWLFIFDGLDEVPGDVKDAVANEVTHFTDDALVGCSSDAAIVCTSRPQGYSGQFSNLEAALVELTSLSREQALACAAPLLALDRSENERNSYIATLRSALQSPAISAIMTTPLQAHIMAVIVRDGGKPPERKWQLFDTFYQVIKKREANRNLPDQELARLLREGDKLLKALHNRLGFELHARAETSQGAQTSLARGELQLIVQEVVSQLQDNFIAETVATLMRATTERLVLVNTPENGEHVRFDIRPLQEFFAAEHIYQSGEASVFVDRVRAVAGDSHWREVMHFLLSALVENNRKSELAIAVTVLTQVDDSGDGGIRLLNRRLARGGLIAARLLAEGVLEQDKRVREQFRGCILPLLGCIDAHSYLSNIASNHSRSWLCDVLLANLKEQAEPETIGAAISLAYLLEDTDHRHIAAKQAILASSFRYLICFCEVVSNDFDREPAAQPQIPAWVVEIALSLLLKDCWWSAGSVALRAISKILEIGNTQIAKVARDLGIKDEAIGVIVPILCIERGARGSRASSHKERRYRVLEVSYFEPVAALDWRKWSAETWTALSSSTGMLQAAYRVFDLLRARTPDAVKALLVSVGGKPSNLALLPESVRSFITQKFDNSNLADCNIDELIERSWPGYTQVLTLQAEANIPEWATLIEEQPWLVSYFLIENRHGAREAFTDPQHQRSLIEAAAAGDFLLYFVPQWGTLFKLPGELGAQLRSLAIQISGEHPREQHLHLSSVAPFILDLPREAALLPHVLHALITLASSPRPTFADEGISSREKIDRLVEQYVPDPAPLHTIIDDAKLSKCVRAAATVLYYLHPKINGVTEPLPSKARLLDLYELGAGRWYLPGVGLMTNDAVAANRQEALDLMGTLIDMSAGDYEVRQAVNFILKNWRELARAPVHHLGSPALWI